MPTNRLTRRLIYRPVCLFSNTIHTTVLPHLNNSINARVLVACLAVVTGEVRRPRRPKAARLVGTVWVMAPWISLVTVYFAEAVAQNIIYPDRAPVSSSALHDSKCCGYYISSLCVWIYWRAFMNYIRCWTTKSSKTARMAQLFKTRFDVSKSNLNEKFGRRTLLWPPRLLWDSFRADVFFIIIKLNNKSL